MTTQQLIENLVLSWIQASGELFGTYSSPKDKGKWYEMVGVSSLTLARWRALVAIIRTMHLSEASMY